MVALGALMRLASGAAKSLGGGGAKKKPPNSQPPKGNIYFWMDPSEIDRLTEDLQAELNQNIQYYLVMGDINFTWRISGFCCW